MKNLKLPLNYSSSIPDINSSTLSQLAHWIKGQDEINKSFIHKLKEDSRRGATKLAKMCMKKNKELKEEKKRIRSMKEIENNIRENGYKYIAGVDEAGKGALAGPVCAAAVIFPEDTDLLKINDSKQLSTKKRENLYAEIIDEARACGIGVGSVKEINEMGIATANRLAMTKALDNLTVEPDYVLIDCIEIDDLEYPSSSIPQGDARSYSIAAASIIAKVTRDRLMIKLSQEHPEYGLEENKGYGTSDHKKAVMEHGYSKIHRRNFRFQDANKAKLNFGC